VLSKVYYHLEEYNDSMTFALAAGDLFKLDAPGEFEETIISKCIDQYITLSAAQHVVPGTASVDTSLPALAETFKGPDGADIISPTTPFSQTTLPPKSLLSRQAADNPMLDAPHALKPGRSGPIAQLTDTSAQESLEHIVEQLFEACLAKNKYRQVVGIAVEAKKMDVLQRVLKRAKAEAKEGPAEELIEYALGICLDIVQERSLRTEMLRLILGLLNEIAKPDYFAIAKCVVYLDADEEVSVMLRQLVEKDDDESTAIAYQIAFDLYDNSTQEFLGKVMKSLPSGEVKKVEAEPGSEAAAESQSLLENVQETPTADDELPNGVKKVYKNIHSILDGSKTIQLNLEFLYRNNRTDLSILNKVRDSLESRTSIFHTALTFCNAFMNQGTTNDQFFRDNLDWLGKAVNWSKFTATAALGVIHRGNLDQSRKLLEPYLPRQGGGHSNNGSVFSQGGALFAYGLIHANHGAGAIDYLKTQFTNTEEAVIQHGGALGVGIAGMATGNAEIFDDLQRILDGDSAVNGEAVGVAMGLIMLGTGNVDAIQTMLSYARETTHEKIVRGVAMGMALIMYGRQEGADVMIEGLLNDPDPTLRYGGIMTVALAYCGTGSNKAVRKLLHIAVSDVSDDVRRIAVMSLGFILFRKPGSVPRMVELLSESYNPHVRYGSAMALGISCAGTGLDEAIDLLEPMMKDPTDYVRQGALISLAMIMIQQNEAMNPKVASIRKTFKKVVGDRHEDAMTKFGAALALGIIDAGGRNCTIGLQTQTGNLNMAGIVGMAVFTQYWYWFPFTHFLSLAFSPTSIIGLDHDLEMPSFKFHCATRPSLFDYPPEQEAKAEEGPAQIATAILSTTAHAKRRAQKKERAMRRESMDVDQTTTADGAKAGAGPSSSSSQPAQVSDKMEVDEEAKKAKSDAKDQDKEKESDKKDKEGENGGEKKKAEKEKVGYDIENMSRVLPGQLKYISFPAGRYRPVKKPTGGPLLLHDTQPHEEKALVDEKLKKVTTERAPVAPSGRGAGGAGGAGSILDILQEQQRRAGAPRDLSELFGQAVRGAEQDAPPPPAPPATEAVDEQEEKAPTPDQFDYYSDTEM
jgi:26S proteasome regulatory subunit N2